MIKPDPSAPQRLASDPDSSVWVGASAGTGKTKILTDRVLRLLLPRDDGRPGTPPHRLLCLTFTKAGAAEMASRINSRLTEWAIINDEALYQQLDDLLGHPPQLDQFEMARTLFAHVVDAPGGLKIQTLHGFCQSLLARFPLEAGLPVHFEAIEDRDAEALLKRASHMVFQAAFSNSPSDETLSKSLDRLSSRLSEDQFSSVLKALQSEQRQLFRVLKQYGSADGYYEALCQKLGVEPRQTGDAILRQACRKGTYHEAGLYSYVREIMEGGSSSFQNSASIIKKWLDAQTDADRFMLFDLYRDVFFTKKHEIRKKFCNQTLADRLDPIMRTEAERLEQALQLAASADMTLHSLDVMTLGSAILHQYDTLKKSHASLDYSDMINISLDLLTGAKTGQNAAGWVMYKLDQGIDHILVDESQDTNPEQWQIVEKLADEFLSGVGARSDVVRSFFSVGDIKQSIFSFQRARPQEFTRMRQFFADKVRQAKLNWRPVDLSISFRSTQAVLSLVDSVFADTTLKFQLGLADDQHVHHDVFRTGHAGHIELWPVESDMDQDSPPSESWILPDTINDRPNSKERLAYQIASTIKDWLDHGEILESQGRPVHPGDIMILLRRRTPFAPMLLRALLSARIPVSGIDRMVLNDELVIQDLQNAAHFALLPHDSLGLACLLKSPFIGFDDAMLEPLAAHRAEKDSLWQCLLHSSHAKIIQWCKEVIEKSRHMSPYDFFESLLNSPCPSNPVSGRHALKSRLGYDIDDPIAEFLDSALHFERDHSPSLQSFLHWQSRDSGEIKRELESAGNQVRIMTVHGSKGLQAPIVFLPDTTIHVGSPPKDSGLLWPDYSGFPLPIAAHQDDLKRSPVWIAANQSKKELDQAEYARLLYVALTRAEDRLYIAGAQGRKALDPKSWYFSIEAGFKKLGIDSDSAQIYKLSAPQTTEPRSKPEPSPSEKTAYKPGFSLPEWIMHHAEAEAEPSYPLSPSKQLNETQDTASSPLNLDNQFRFKRGTLTHKLLQYLPNLPLEKRADAAQLYMTRNGSDLSKDLQKSIIDEVMAIMQDPACMPLFSKGSMAEVPVSGMVEINGAQQVMSGQVDRICITDDTVYIIDYKTNRPPPDTLEKVPKSYTLQMNAYRQLLQSIYPRHDIRCALLWTDGPKLLWLP